MSETKPTPGPYKLRPPSDDNPSWCIVTDDDPEPWVLADLAGGFEDEDTPRVNGEMLVRAANSYADLLAAAHAAVAYDIAIQHAGRHGKPWVDSTGGDASLDALYEDWIGKATAAIKKAEGQ